MMSDLDHEVAYAEIARRDWEREFWKSEDQRIRAEIDAEFPPERIEN
jgi:hypothetical protein